MLAKRKKIYATVLDLEKAFTKIDWEAMQDVLKAFRVSAKLLSGVK